MNSEAKTQNNHFGLRPDLLVCLQRDCSCLLDALELLYADRTALSRVEVARLYSSLRYDGVSSKQLNAAVSKVCTGSLESESSIKKHELAQLLPELDRRYFIVQGARWEFAFLDRYKRGEISEKDALFLFKAVHGSRFVMQSWETFLEERDHQGSKVTWEELELPLCDIPDEREFQSLKEKEQSRVNAARLAKEKELAQKRKERLAKEREKRLQSARKQALVREREKQLIKEQQLAKEREEQLAREREQEVGNNKIVSEEATDYRAEELKVDDAGVSEPVERSHDSEENADSAAMGEKHRRLRLRLERAVQSKDEAELEPAIEDVKKEKIPNCSELLDKAEKLMKKLRAAKNLHDATLARQVVALEKAIEVVRKGGWEKDLQKEMEEATALMEKLRRLEQRKRAVLELSQRVIAELKSYSNPPPLVHQVMRATFLLLGNPEQETKSWQATQVLIGKTGKGSLKRRVAECSAEKIPLDVAERALTMLKQFDFITIQDTSLGCATFHAWAEGVVEEVKELKQK